MTNQIAPLPDGESKADDSPTIVELLAPVDLAEGHILYIEVHGDVMSVAVPVGGVKAGQTFEGLVQPLPANKAPKPKSGYAKPVTFYHSPPKHHIKTIVELNAPSTMSEGQQFQVDLGGRIVLATVPAGGVKKGHLFNAIVENPDEEVQTTDAPKKTEQALDPKKNERVLDSIPKSGNDCSQIDDDPAAQHGVFSCLEIFLGRRFRKMRVQRTVANNKGAGAKVSK